MTSSKKKGQAKELLCQKELERDGWRVIFRSMTVKLGPIYKGLDLADCIDVVAVKIIAYRTWRLISCTHEGHGPEKTRAILAFANEHGLKGMKFEVWTWLKSKWCGRGKNKKWRQAGWKQEVVWW